MLPFARVAESIDSVVLGFEHPEQTRARHVIRPPRAFDERFADLTCCQWSTVLDKPRNPKNLSAELGMWVAVVVEPMTDVYDHGHESW